MSNIDDYIEKHSPHGEAVTEWRYLALELAYAVKADLQSTTGEEV